MKMSNAEREIHGMSEGNFTFRKFMLTGKEIFVEMRSALHTGRGKAGFLLLFIGILWGVFQIVDGGHDVEQSDMLIPVLWSTMGLVMLINLQNHKLLFLMPISRKEFAAAQIRKMIWSIFIILGIMVIFYLFLYQNAEYFWMNLVGKAIPISTSFASYQIASMKPMADSDIVGTKMYHLSYVVLFLDFGISFGNFVWPMESWSILDLIFPVLNYAVNIYMICYFYRRISGSDLYYDEL